ncbi:MAG: SUMF1/EgtB/PvdO family nonheme iron enzyme [Planctomycetes bacterium]|nr:SUMF1/EgtB/PvdO family nonheme iron enzyme [Planctomycetota bacterium]
MAYVLDFRDRQRGLSPRMPAESAIRVLPPVAYWMHSQEDTENSKGGQDQVQKADFHTHVQTQIDTLNTPHNRIEAKDFCENLRDRAGLIVDYGEDHYIFRHKSYREYLLGLEMKRRAHEKAYLKEIVLHLGDDWWDEPFRFFIAEADATDFDRFMETVFKSGFSKELSQKQQNLLRMMIKEAGQRKIKGLVKCLNNRKLHDNKKPYILECLKIVGTDDAIDAIDDYRLKAEGAAAAKAEEIIAEEIGVVPSMTQDVDVSRLVSESEKSFRNPNELGAEYILIPSGFYTYKEGGEAQHVDATNFAKYPVTNQRYRRFIEYLAGEGEEMQQTLPHAEFFRQLIEFAQQCEIGGMSDYIGDDARQLPDKLRSTYDNEKRFNGPDQPVVRISWYAARAYCLWLGALEKPIEGDAEVEYRLPREYEWQWAAGKGNERAYPWDNGEPTEKRANYDQNIGATTTVDSYPDGATPEGLMDMAGNVFEWMANYYDDDKD